MNTKQTLKNQDLFSFIFKDQEQKSPFQFVIHLPSDFKETVTKPMLESDAGHVLKLDEFAAFQLDIDLGINMFYFAFIKVFSYQKRESFLNYQYEQCQHKLTFLYRLESLASVNYWYAFGENSHYNPDTEKEVMTWIMEKYSGISNQKPSMKIITNGKN